MTIRRKEKNGRVRTADKFSVKPTNFFKHINPIELEAKAKGINAMLQYFGKVNGKLVIAA